MVLYLAVPYVRVRATRTKFGRTSVYYLYAPPRCRTSLYHWTFNHLSRLSVFLWKGLADPVFDGVGLWRFQANGQCFFIGLRYSLSFCLLLFYISFNFSMGWYCGTVVFELIGCQLLSPNLPLHYKDTGHNTFCRDILI